MTVTATAPMMMMNPPHHHQMVMTVVEVVTSNRYGPGFDVVLTVLNSWY